VAEPPDVAAPMPSDRDAPPGTRIEEFADALLAGKAIRWIALCNGGFSSCRYRGLRQVGSSTRAAKRFAGSLCG